MSSMQQQRVSELVRQEMVILIEQDLQDPVLDTVKVAEVLVSRDRRSVRVHVTHDDAAVTPEEVLRALQRAQGYCRRELAARHILRVVPECHFVYSDAEKTASRVHAILDSLDLDPPHDS